MSSAAPELAAVVLSVGAPPELSAAVRSLLQQTEPVEIIVVNSGGGDVRAVLPAGADIVVVSHEELLWPGAARNAGIMATKARWIGFLASDLVADRDWAAQRLALHRTGARSVASAVLNADPRNLFACASHIALHVRRMPGIPKRKANRYGASYHRSLFEDYGLFRADLRIGEDTEFNRRLRKPDRPVWAPQVRAAHAYPTSLSALIGDQMVRGERLATYWPATAALAGHPVRRSIARFFEVGPLALRATRGLDRLRVLAALPLVALCAFAYEFGVERALRRKG